MRILILAGTGFLGSALVASLRASHDVAVFHRGHDCGGDPLVHHIHGDRSDLSQHADRLREFAPDIVIDMAARNGDDVAATIPALEGLCERVICISSGSVFRSFGILMRCDPGPPENRAFAEEDVKRMTFYPYRGVEPRRPDHPRHWLDDYDKILAEGAYKRSSIPTTIVRMPLIYGPGDPDGRVARYARLMRSGDGNVPLCESAFGWRNSRIALANAVEAITLVVERAELGRDYNLAEPEDFSERDWIGLIGKELGWTGRIVAVADGDPRGIPVDDLPPHANFAQHLRMHSGRIRDELGFAEPIPQVEGLRRALDLCARGVVR